MNSAILYTFGSFSRVNDFLEPELARQLDHLKWTRKDVEELYARRSPVNALATAWEYRRDIIGRKRPLRGMLLHSSHYFDRVREATRTYTRARQPAFTIQTQSLWSAATPGTPHFIYTDHTELAWDRYDHYTERQLYPPEWTAREMEVYAEADHIFTTSKFCIDSLVEDYGVDRSKCSCVYSGINLPHRQEYPRAATVGSAEILFIGVEWERKGGPSLFRAFQRLREEFADVRLTVIGCTPPLPETPGLEIVGFVDSVALKPYLERAGIFSLPSLAEPSSVAMVEAYAYHLPVVATDTGGSADRVIDGQTGFLVPPADDEALYQALRKLVGTPDLAHRMGLAGRQLMDQHFTWERVVEKMKTKIAALTAV